VVESVHRTLSRSLEMFVGFYIWLYPLTEGPSLINLFFIYVTLAGIMACTASGVGLALTGLYDDPKVLAREVIS